MSRPCGIPPALRCVEMDGGADEGADGFVPRILKAQAVAAGGGGDEVADARQHALGGDGQEAWPGQVRHERHRRSRVGWAASVRAACDLLVLEAMPLYAGIARRHAIEREGAIQGAPWATDGMGREREPMATPLPPPRPPTLLRHSTLEAFTMRRLSYIFPLSSCFKRVYGSEPSRVQPDVGVVCRPGFLGRRCECLGSRPVCGRRAATDCREVGGLDSATPPILNCQRNR